MLHSLWFLFLCNDFLRLNCFICVFWRCPSAASCPFRWRLLVFLCVPAGNTLCKSGSIAVFGNVVYSGLLNDHLWHLGVPLFTRLVRLYIFTVCYVLFLLQILNTHLCLVQCLWQHKDQLCFLWLPGQWRHFCSDSVHLSMSLRCSQSSTDESDKRQH